MVFRWLNVSVMEILFLIMKNKTLIIVSPFNLPFLYNLYCFLAAIKQQLNDNFGKWFISKNGRWVRLGKNPNEFGENELRLVMDELPEEKRQVVSICLSKQNNQ